MSSSSADWKSLAAMLVAYRDEQIRTWGDTDDLLVAQYLAGACTPAERRQVEQWMQDYPAAKELVDMVRESVVEAAAPQVQPQPQAAAVPSSILGRVWSQGGSASIHLLQETISACLDQAGDMLVDGLLSCLVSQTGLAGVTLDEKERHFREWQIPLPPTASRLHLRLQAVREQNWRLKLSIDQTLADAWIELGRPGESPELSDRFDRWERRDMPLDPGVWELEIRTSEHRWRLAMAVGLAPNQAF